jgi:hypothetical protein
MASSPSLQSKNQPRDRTIGIAFDCDFTTMRGHDLAAQAQAYTASLALGRKERHEDLLDRFSVDSCSNVHYADHSATEAQLAAQLEARIGNPPHGIQCISDKIDQNLVQQGRVCGNLQRPGTTLNERNRARCCCFTARISECADATLLAVGKVEIILPQFAAFLEKLLTFSLAHPATFGILLLGIAVGTVSAQNGDGRNHATPALSLRRAQRQSDPFFGGDCFVASLLVKTN